MALQNGPFAIYSRKSKFTGTGESIENQVEMCRQFIAMHYGQEAAQTAMAYEDEGFSGGNLDRPQFQKMMQDAKKMHFRAIVVYRLDRISRNIGDFAGLIETLGGANMDFISIKEQFDTGSPLGRAMMYICSVFSQLERETIAERIRDNMYELSKTGRWLGGNTPTGYASESVITVTVDGKSKKACKLKVIPEEIRLVKVIFEKFLDVHSLTKTEEFLLINGYQSKHGKPLSRFAIKNILTNPVYMIADADAYPYLQTQVNLFSQQADFDGIHGVMAYNRTLQQRGKTQQLRPMGEWIVSVGKHEGVISGANWIKVQKILERNKPSAYGRPRSHTALLSGQLRCAHCGGYMRPKMTRRKNASGENIYSYLCSTKEHSKGRLCAMKNPNGNLLDEMVLAQIKKLTGDSCEWIKHMEKNKKTLQGNPEGLGNDIERIRTLVAENEVTMKALTGSLARAAGTSAEKYIMEQIQHLHDRGEKLRQQLQALEVLEQMQTADEAFAGLLTSFAAIVDGCSLEEKRDFVQNLVKQVVWDGENAQLYLFGAP